MLCFMWQSPLPNGVSGFPYVGPNQYVATVSFNKLQWMNGFANDQLALKAYTGIAYGSPEGFSYTRSIPYVMLEQFVVVVVDVVVVIALYGAAALYGAGAVLSPCEVKHIAMVLLCRG